MPMLTKIPWLLTRLFKMPLPEIPYRINQKFRKRSDKRVFNHSGFKAKTDYTPFIRSVFRITDCCQADEFENVFPEQKDDILTKADQYLENRFDLFGIKTGFGREIDWHLAPETGRRWPLKFCDDIDHRDGKTIGVVKFVWEINRLDFLPFLGLAYHLTGKNRYAEKILSTVAHWQQE
ncbi:MAG: hypothetical protein U9P10_07435, partial [Thermodesulfobacteriota bacterium]|nr:hypothetical protein [Thermodesulfobacteriota bacterium]